MVVGQGQVRGHRPLLELLLLPRPITRFALWGLGALAGGAAWLWMPPKLIAYFSGVLGPFCLLCAGAVWSMRDKLDAVIDGEHMDVESYRRTVQSSIAERRRFMTRAAWTAACAMLAVSAAISWQVVGALWQWMPIAGAIAVGESAYSYMLANSWEEALRAFRVRKILDAKREDERERLIQQISASAAPRTGSEGWVHH